ncbi:MAG: hypothetical protein IJO46_11110 [Thermoguttaceae bacterium]|nr:hypothetical protein [Thermoguttaceae bacterium]MBQ7110683.1 hypothetical protein [Thermoguttaceae bacterium]
MSTTPAKRPDELLTLARVRREFFDPRDAPSKRDLEKWIVQGTAEGARLRGVKIDGRFYARRRDVEIFVEKSLVVPRDDKPTRSGVDQNRCEAALESLRRRGVKC